MSKYIVRRGLHGYFLWEKRNIGGEVAYYDIKMRFRTKASVENFINRRKKKGDVK